MNRGALLVTGGVRGIGAEIARRAAANGQAVALVYEARSEAAVIGTETRFTQPKEYLERALSQVPLARMGEPSEVAAAVLWLLSEQASYVSGATLDVAGGL